MSLSRFVGILVLALVGQSVSATQNALAAPGDEVKAACVAAHVDAQKLRREGRLVSAVRQLDVCGAEACPSLVQKDCLEWRESWNAAIPTIVVVARDRSGKEVFDARLSIDGAPQATRLDGRALPLDPGRHQIRVDLADGTSNSATVLLREGEQRRRVELGQAPKLALATTESSSPPQYDPVIWGSLATVATVGTGVFALLAALGKSQESELEECAPNCQEEDVAVMREQYLGADISLGIGAAGAVGLALYFGIVSATAPKAPPPAGATLLVLPDPNGLVVGARFAIPSP